MDLFLNVLTPHLSQETSQQRRKANMRRASAQVSSVEIKRLHQQIHELLERRRARDQSTVGICKSNSSSRSQDAHQLLHQGNPAVRMDKTNEKACIDQIKGRVRKVERL